MCCEFEPCKCQEIIRKCVYFSLCAGSLAMGRWGLVFLHLRHISGRCWVESVVKRWVTGFICVPSKFRVFPFWAVLRDHIFDSVVQIWVRAFQIYCFLSATLVLALSYVGVRVDLKRNAIPPNLKFFFLACLLLSTQVLQNFCQRQHCILLSLHKHKVNTFLITTFLSPHYHFIILGALLAMSPRVLPSRRSRQAPTPDIWMPPPTDAALAATIKRVNARLAQRAAVKVSKASAPNVAAKRQEVPRVPRVARQPRQHATTPESKESSLKGMCHSHPPSWPSMESRLFYHSHSACCSCAT